MASGSKGANVTSSLTRLACWSVLPFTVPMFRIAPLGDAGIACRAMDGAPDLLKSIAITYPLLRQIFAPSWQIAAQSPAGQRMEATLDPS